jgi:hypothetical protein
MRSLFFISFVAVALYSCNPKDKQPDKKNENNGYTVSKDGIGDLKIGMTQPELEKLLNQQFQFNAMKDSAGYWQDTVKAKYRDIDVSLYFERQYVTDDSSYMQLSGVETNNPLCKTASGIGIGDDKPTIIAAFDDNPVSMGPEFEQVNDSTWLPSKIKYSINVRDDKYDRELIFHLTNKKVSSLQASIVMGD